MKLLMMFAALLALAETAQGAATSSEPALVDLVPSGKWTVDYAKSSCVISRTYGEGGAQTILGIKPAPYSDTIRVMFIQPSPKGRSAQGNAEVALSGGMVPERVYFLTVTSNGKRLTSVDVPRATLDSLGKGETLTIKAGKFIHVRVQSNGFEKVLVALKDCEADLLASWGFDRAAQAAVATPPKGSLQGVFHPDDYPSNLLESGIQGSVGMRLRIESDGSISDCVPFESSGNSTLDKYTCTLAKRRARFSPAIGHDGKPHWSFYFSRVTWMLG